jgi:hypothetical protein
MSTREDREKVALDIFLTFETQHASHFSAHLIRLIHKADGVNRNLIARAYPQHVEMFQEWWGSPTTEAFYDKYNVK